MDDAIVRLLMRKNRRASEAIKESLALHSIKEADKEEEEEEELDIPEDDVAPEEEEKEDNTTPRIPSHDTEEEETPEDEEYIDPDGDTEEENQEDEGGEEYINPLDNSYAVKHTIGQEVVLAYANGTKSKLKGEIDGYDIEGFYRIRWSNGLTTNGITDLAIADIVKSTNESKCVCGSTKFIKEGKYIVCDDCGRHIRESLDPLTIADKSRPAGKKMIRSEAHPMSTATKPNISEAIKKALKKDLKEDLEERDEEEEDEDDVFSSLKSLDNQFWTRENEMIEDIEELGYDVLEHNREYISVCPKGDVDEELYIPVGGTSRTIVLDFSRAHRV